MGQILMNVIFFSSLFAFLLVICNARSLHRTDGSNGRIMKGLVHLLDEIVQEDEMISSRKNYRRGCSDQKPYTCTLVISTHPKGCSKFGNLCKLSCGHC